MLGSDLTVVGYHLTKDEGLLMPSALPDWPLKGVIGRSSIMKRARIPSCINEVGAYLNYERILFWGIYGDPII